MEHKNNSKIERCRNSFPDINTENGKIKIKYYCIKNAEKQDDMIPCSKEMCEKCEYFDSKYIEFPLEVLGIHNDSITTKGCAKKEGSLVEIKPCAEEYKGKSYIGFYLGELPISIYNSYNRETKILTNTTLNNPAIFVPELGKIIYGCESWWRIINSIEDFKGITESDIENTWYVKMLKSINNIDDKKKNNTKEKSIKEIREMSNLSKKEFCDKYDIPLSTLNKWETEKGKQNHRECPIYFRKLLEKAVKNDF